MAGLGWMLWKVTRPDDGELAWFGITRPGARSALDRDKMWTLVPGNRLFVANWYVTEDFLRSPGGRWVFENVDSAEARDVLPDVPDPSPDDLTRITRPERVLTVDQIDRFTVLKVLKVLGIRADDSLRVRP